MAEKKYFITDIAKFGHTDLMVPLTNISEGSANTDRIGTKISLTSLELKFTSVPPVAPVTAFANVHFCACAFIWKDDTVPTPATLFDPYMNTATAIRRTLMPFNHDYKTMRKVLWTKRWSAVYFFDNTTSEYWCLTPGVTRTFEVNINLAKLNKRVDFNPGVTTTARGHVYLWIGSSDNGAAANQGSSCSGTAKVTYVDM